QDYLTKPINMDELTHLASDCVKRFDEARKDSFEDREDLLRKLLMYEVSDSGPLKEMEHDHCMVLIFESPDSGRLMAAAAGHMREQGAYVLMQRENRCEIAVISPTRMTVEMRASLFVSHTRQLFSEQGQSLTCAQSNVLWGIRLLDQCYQEAHEALKLKYIKGDNQNLRFQDIKGEGKESDPSPILDIDLITPVKSGNVKLLEKRMGELEALLKQAGMDSYIYMQFMVSSLYSTVLKELGDAGICAELVFENPVEEYKKLIGCETIGKAIGVLGENLKRICEYAGSQKSGAYSRPVVKALAYMEENYSSPALSLEDTAAAAGLSSARFSTSFKSETGVAFTDYLLKLRMEKAKELMRDPNRKIYEIAMMTGYSNIPYFSTAFKKYTGCPPSEYREKRQGFSGQTRDSVID
ncbi:MAG: AraC family transcriptional regulator, partial [Enterocloster clostridioformis]|nr:AraC family transcriptional regulator [Enterocloster clostridioformis]